MILSAAAMTTTSKDTKTRVAKRAFFTGLFDLSWRLLGAMLAPLFVGLYIDSQRGHGQVFAFSGFGLGMILGGFVIRAVVLKLSKDESSSK